MVLISVLFSNVMHAQSDECVGATPLVVDTECNYQNFTNVNSGFTDSSYDVGLGCGFGGDESRDFWYSFTATSTNTIINAIGYGSADLVMSILDDCAAPTLIDCADYEDDGDYESINIPTTIGQTYYIHLFSFNGNVIANFDICVTEPPVCINSPTDDCASATLLDQNEPFCGSLTNGAYTLDPSDPGFCGDDFGAFDFSAWFQFEAQETSATYSWGTYSSLLADCIDGIQIQVYSGSCGSLVPVGSCISDTGGGTYNTETVTGLTVGDTYYIFVDRRNNGECDFFIEPIDGIVDCGPSGFITN